MERKRKTEQDCTSILIMIAKRMWKVWKWGIGRTASIYCIISWPKAHGLSDLAAKQWRVDLVRDLALMKKREIASDRAS